MISRVKIKPYGITKDKENVNLFTLKNKNGMIVDCIDYGATLVNIIIPDKNGNNVDIALGCNSLKGYEEDNQCLGAFVGRHANRIENAEFAINGVTYNLQKNDGENNLHGGIPGYNKFIYKTNVIESEDKVSVEFTRISPDMENGFPGNLDIKVVYSLNDLNELIIDYYAISDKDTIVNLTNHSYFNLSGHNYGSIDEHKLWIKSNYYTPTNDQLIPTGEVKDVTDTPMDFRELKSIGEDINKDYLQLTLAGGYDHNFVLDIDGDKVEKVAKVISDKTGIVMEVFTDKPGMQLYTGNFMEEVIDSKDNAIYKKRGAYCLETQYFPNSPNTKEFTSCLLKKGEKYKFTTIYKLTNL